LTGWHTCFKSASGEIFFGGFSGGTSFFPDKVVDNTYVPPVVFTDFWLSGHSVEVGGNSPLKESISYTDSITLSHKQFPFSLQFAALSYSSPASNRYRYRLDGLDTQWNEVGVDQRVVSYTTLPPGRYTFLVQTSTGQTGWNSTFATLHIQVLPAWWVTWWFRSSLAALLVALLWGGYRWRIEHLKRQERKLRDVVETIPTLAWTALPDGSIDFINGQLQRSVGLSIEKIQGSGWVAAVHPLDVKRHLESWRVSLATGEPFENEVRLRLEADSQYRWFWARAVPLRDARGKIIKWYGISTDIEDRKRAEQEREALQADLAHLNRVSTLGELAASLSHELKQPITAAITDAKTCATWLNRDQPDVGEAIEATMRIVEDGKRATEIIDRLRSLYKKAPEQRELVDVNEIIREMTELLRGEASRYRVSMPTDLDVKISKISADRVQLQQVLMNLMLNGIEAMKETGGVLTVKAQLDQSGRVLISVSDTGVGLPAGFADKIFNAFFTTKPQGSGMGLSISRTIVESHGGRLWAVPNSGRGATFHIALPTEADIGKAPYTVNDSEVA
jgi:PAS domain S-box-containing protein